MANSDSHARDSEPIKPGSDVTDAIVLDDSASDGSHSTNSTETIGAANTSAAPLQPVNQAGGRKRKSERSSEGDSAHKSEGTGPTEGQPTVKKKRIRQPPPGHGIGPAVKYSRDCARLTASLTKGRNLPRLIDMDAFPDDVNLATAAMPDFVATILYRHNPDTLNQFLDTTLTGGFEFLIQDRRAEDQPFAIATKVVDGFTEVYMGYYNLPSNAGFRNDGVKWRLRYVYRIEENGKWKAVRLEEHEETISQHKTVVEVKAAEFGRYCLLTKVWDSVEGRYAFRVSVT